MKLTPYLFSIVVLLSFSSCKKEVVTTESLPFTFSTEWQSDVFHGGEIKDVIVDENYIHYVSTPQDLVRFHRLDKQNGLLIDSFSFNKPEAHKFTISPFDYKDNWYHFDNGGFQYFYNTDNKTNRELWNANIGVANLHPNGIAYIQKTDNPSLYKALHSWDLSSDVQKLQDSLPENIVQNMLGEIPGEDDMLCWIKTFLPNSGASTGTHYIAKYNPSDKSFSKSDSILPFGDERVNEEAFVITENKAYVSFEFINTFIFCVDLETMKIDWEQEFDFKHGINFMQKSGDKIVIRSSEKIMVLDAIDGKPLWEKTNNSDLADIKVTDTHVFAINRLFDDNELVVYLLSDGSVQARNRAASMIGLTADEVIATEFEVDSDNTVYCAGKNKFFKLKLVPNP